MVTCNVSVWARETYQTAMRWLRPGGNAISFVSVGTSLASNLSIVFMSMVLQLRYDPVWILQHFTKLQLARSGVVCSKLPTHQLFQVGELRTVDDNPLCMREPLIISASLCRC